MSSSSADGDPSSSGAKRGAESPNGSSAGSAFHLQPKTSSPSLTPRQTSVTPLAPLEFLQNQRRGSITDPSLHAGPHPPTFPGGPPGSSGITSPFRRPESPATSYPSSASHESRRSFSQSRPLSPYKFGDASAQPGESPNAHLRRVLRSPSAETVDRRTPTQAMAVDSAREGGTQGLERERNGGEGELIRDRCATTGDGMSERSSLPHPLYVQFRTGQRAATTWMSTRTSMRNSMAKKEVGTRGRTRAPGTWKTWTTTAAGSLW